MTSQNSKSKPKYGDNSEGVHYIRHESHCPKGCFIIVGCSLFWKSGSQPCIICEGANRNIPVTKICSLLDKYYLNEEVSDPKVLPPLVPKYITRWEKEGYFNEK